MPRKKLTTEAARPPSEQHEVLRTASTLPRALDRQTGLLRAMARGAYDLQRLRMQTGHRVVTNFKVKLGQSPGTSEQELDKEAKEVLKALRASFATITDALIKGPRSKHRFTGDGVISSSAEYALVEHYLSLEKREQEHFDRLKEIVADFPLWQGFLKDVSGVGPAMASVLMSEIDLSRATYASSIWRYAGLDVAPDGKGRSRRKEHLVKARYQNRDGEWAERNAITYNPFLKTKVLGVLAGSFLKQGERSPYATLYHQYKHRLENEEPYKSSTKMHRHRMALRYMVKRFLADYYEQGRAILGLPVHRPYAEAKLGVSHSAPRREASG